MGSRTVYVNLIVFSLVAGLAGCRSDPAGPVCVPNLMVSPAGPFALIPNLSVSLAAQIIGGKMCLNPAPRSAPTKWLSSNPAIAAVTSHTDSTATVTAIAGGTADITVIVPTVGGDAQSVLRVIVAVPANAQRHDANHDRR
jgi:hypothetical protein